MCLSTNIAYTRQVYEKLKKRSVNGEVMVYKILYKVGLRSPFRTCYQYKYGENLSNSRTVPFVKKTVKVRHWDTLNIHRGLHVYLTRNKARKVKKSRWPDRNYKIVKFRAKLEDLLGANLDNHAVFSKLYLPFQS
jgi:hypothetical protein